MELDHIQNGQSVSTSCSAVNTMYPGASKPARIDPAEIKRTLSTLIEQGQVFELRVLNAMTKVDPENRLVARELEKRWN